MGGKARARKRHLDGHGVNCAHLNFHRAGWAYVWQHLTVLEGFHALSGGPVVFQLEALAVRTSSCAISGTLGHPSALEAQLSLHSKCRRYSRAPGCSHIPAPHIQPRALSSAHSEASC